MIAASVSRPLKSEGWVVWPAVMFIASMATLVRSYLGIKLFFVALFLLAFLMSAYLKRTRVVVYRGLLWFYIWIGIAGLVWAFVGLLHPTNYIQGIFDALKLYVIWSVAFFVLYTALRAVPSLRILHIAMIAAGILVPMINLVGLYDLLNGGSLISEGIWEELNVQIGFGDGYIQFASENVSVMFLVAPYLLSLQFRADAGKSNSPLTKLALALSLVLVVLSGRRALWLVVGLTPLAVLVMSHLTGSYGLIKAGGKRVLLSCAAAGVVGIGVLLILHETETDIGSVSYLQQAFSSDDERAIQSPYLVNGFLRAPILGSGFGAYAGYTRSELKPWMYELTYHTLLFNMGIVGAGLILGLFSLYFARVVRLLRRFMSGSAIPFGLLIAFCSLLVGAYSNPYFGGFDTLFFAGLLPYLSTFQQGFLNQ